MAIGRINGPMLYSNLERQGIDLAIDANLIYAAVTSRYVGINTASPQYPLDSPGNTRLANLLVLGNGIYSNSGKVTFGSVSNVFLTGGYANNVIITDGTGNLSFLDIGSIIANGSVQANTIHGNISTANVAFFTNVTVASSNYAYDIALFNTLTGNSASYGNTQFTYNPGLGTLTVPNANIVLANVTTANIANLASAFGNFSNVLSQTATVTGNIIVANVNATLVSGTINTPAQPYITSVGPMTSLNVVGNITAGNVSGTYLTGTLNTAAQPYVTSLGALTSLTTVGNITAPLIAVDQIVPNTTTSVSFASNTSIALPVGTTAQRPAGVIGEIRVNSDTGYLEFSNGLIWIELGQALAEDAVAGQDFYGDGVNTTYPLQYETFDPSSIIVSINGAMQQPGVAYTISGDNMHIVFAEVVLSTDLVDIRFLSSGLQSWQGGNVANIAIFTNSTSSANVYSGAVQVVGGVGVQGNVNAGSVYTTGYFYANGAPFNYGNVQVAAYLVQNPQYSNANVASYLTSANIVAYSNANVASYLTSANIVAYSNANVASYLTIYSGNIAGSNLTVSNTASIASNLSVGGNLTVSNTASLLGSTNSFGAILKNVSETVNIIAAAPTANANIYLSNGAVQYFTTAATNNWNVNIAFSTTTSLNNAMSIGQATTLAVLVTQGLTPYYSANVQIDGTTVTTNWQGGIAPTTGNPSGVDAYSYTIIKTANATYTVLGSLTQF